MEIYCDDTTEEDSLGVPLKNEGRNEPSDTANITRMLNAGGSDPVKRNTNQIYPVGYFGIECSVPGCKNRYNDPTTPHNKVGFFPLPEDAAQRQTWLRKIGREEGEKHLRICGAHFHPAMILPPGDTLAPEAVPSFSIPRGSSSMEGKTLKVVPRAESSIGANPPVSTTQAAEVGVATTTSASPAAGTAKGITPSGEAAATNTSKAIKTGISYQWCAHVCRGLLALQKIATLCDVHLAGSDATIPAHSAILSVTCPALTSLFSSVTSPQAGGLKLHIVDLRKYTAQVIAQVVRLCYTGPWTSDVTDLSSDVISCATSLGMNIRGILKMAGQEVTAKVRGHANDATKCPALVQDIRGQKGHADHTGTRNMVICPGQFGTLVMKKEKLVPLIMTPVNLPPNKAVKLPTQRQGVQKSAPKPEVKKEPEKKQPQNTEKRPSPVTLTLNAAAFRRSRTEKVTLADLEPGCVGLRYIMSNLTFSPNHKLCGTQLYDESDNLLEIPDKFLELITMDAVKNIGDKVRKIVVNIEPNKQNKTNQGNATEDNDISSEVTTPSKQDKPTKVITTPKQSQYDDYIIPKRTGKGSYKKPKKCPRCLRAYVTKSGYKKHVALNNCVKRDDVSTGNDVSLDNDINSEVSKVDDNIFDNDVISDDVKDTYDGDTQTEASGRLSDDLTDVEGQDEESEEQPVDDVTENYSDDDYNSDLGDSDKEMMSRKRKSRDDDDYDYTPGESDDEAEVTSRPGRACAVKKKCKDPDPEYTPDAQAQKPDSDSDYDPDLDEGQHEQDTAGISIDRFKKEEYEKTMINLHNLDLIRDKDRRFCCSLCSYNVRVTIAFYRHLMVKHDVIYTLQCKLCDRKLQTLTSAWLHVNDHKVCAANECDVVCDRRIPKLKCFKCEELFDEQEVYEAHAPSCDGKALCPHCGKKYNVSLMKNHIKTHDQVKISCKICGAKLVKTSLAAHVKAMHKDDKHVCITCGKVFNRKCNLQIHERIHTGVKPFVCQLCGKAFRVKCLLQLHTKSHFR